MSSSVFRPAKLSALVFLLGLLISGAMVSQSQVAADQLNLLGLGWRLAFEGEWAPHGNPTTTGHFTPGALTAPLVGLPLLVWQHHRAATLLVLTSHLLAYILLDRLLKRLLSPTERLLFAILYWLSPWRLYHSAFLWNPNYLFLIGALHLWTANKMRREARFWPSLGHVLVIGLGAQIALHTLPLATCTLFLWWRRYVRLHLGGAILAAGVVIATLLPWIAAVLSDSLPPLEVDSGRWFFLANTALRAAVYWVRYASLALPRELLTLDFTRFLGAAAQARLAMPLALTASIIYVSTFVVALWANLRLWRGPIGRWGHSGSSDDSERVWLEGVTRWSLVALIVTFALSPLTVSRWYAFSLFHLAVLPMVFWLGERHRDQATARGAHLGAKAYLVASALLGLLLFLGAPMYRCGDSRGSSAATLPELRYDHPLLDRFGVNSTCAPTLNRAQGWWIETLEPPQLTYSP